MSFSFGSPTTTSSGTFGTTTPSTGFPFGSGDAKPFFGGPTTENKPAFNFTSPTTTPSFGNFAFGQKTTASAAPSQSLFAPPTTSAGTAFGASKQLSFGGFASPPNQTVGSPGFGQPAQNAAQNLSFTGGTQQQQPPPFGTPTTQATTGASSFGSPGWFGYGQQTATTTGLAFATPSSGFSAAPQPATATTATAPQTTQSGFAFGSTTTTVNLGSTTSTAFGQSPSFNKPSFGLGTAIGFGTTTAGAAAPTFVSPTPATSFQPGQTPIASISTLANQTGLSFATQPTGTTTTALSFGQTTAPAFSTTTQPGLSFAPQPTQQTGLNFGATTTAQSGFGFATPATQAGLTSATTSSGLGFGKSGFSFGPPTTAPSTGLSFGTVTTAATSTGLGFATPAISAATSTGLGFGTPATTAAISTGLSYGTPASTAATSTGLGFGTSASTTATSIGIGFGPPASTAATSGLSFITPASTVAASTGLSFATASTAPSTGLSFGPPTTAPTSTGLNFGTTTSGGLSFGTTSGGLSFAKPTLTTAPALSAASTTSSGITPLGKSTTTSAMPTLTTVTTTTAAPPQPFSSINFAQLEENINKWTLELEEQEKTFINQATQINAWDRLLIANGEKIVELNDAVQSVKNEQQSLDHELDFVLAQQKELEDLLAPLEKQLLEDSGDRLRDPEREQMYSLAENLDTQLRQMSEDLKEVIEHLNETNRSQDSNDPIVQIGRILNAHMSSMQWIDNSIAQISTKLDQLKATHDTLRRDNERSFQLTYN